MKKKKIRSSRKKVKRPWYSNIKIVIPVAFAAFISIYSFYQLFSPEPYLRTLAMYAVSFVHNTYIELTKEYDEVETQTAVEKLEKEIAKEIPQFDTKDWKEYKNDWYGFSVKYPPDWQYPQIKKALTNDKNDYKYTFLKNKLNPSDKFKGFNVYTYDTKKTSDMTNTYEFQEKEQNKCSFSLNFNPLNPESKDHLRYEIDISEDNICYQQNYFFSIKRDKYIYNIVPILVDKNAQANLNKEDVLNNFPEFYQINAEFKLIDIKEKTKITRLFIPKMTCQHPERKPRKSKKKKGRHMDEDCCMDPDEWPNPNCRY